MKKVRKKSSSEDRNQLTSQTKDSDMQHKLEMCSTGITQKPEKNSRKKLSSDETN